MVNPGEIMRRVAIPILACCTPMLTLVPADVHAGNLCSVRLGKAVTISGTIRALDPIKHQYNAWLTERNGDCGITATVSKKGNCRVGGSMTATGELFEIPFAGRYLMPVTSFSCR
jgi:hypothetical protein